MSIPQVRAEIARAMKTSDPCEDAHISSAEMKGIGATAERNRFTRGEARLVADLLERGHFLRPGESMTEACPEHGGDWFSIDAGAVREANALFVRNAAPYGQNEANMRTRVLRALDDLELGEPLAKAPSTSSLHPLFIDDARMIDGPRRDAYINSKKSSFYLKVTGSGMGGPSTIGPYWYGPFAADLRAPVVSDKKIERMTVALRKAMREGSASFEVKPPPLGVRMIRAELFSERHPDGYSYAALIPVGALTPTSIPSDPNKAKSFFVERTGGYGGLTELAGPFAVR